MFGGGHRVSWMAVWVVVMATGPAAAQESGSVPASVPATESVLVAPVQGSAALRAQHGDRVLGALRRALDARGYQATVSPVSLRQAVVACQTPECAEQALDAAGAGFALVPAVWERESDGTELTLTLLQRSRRSLNASRLLAGDLSGAAAELLDELLARQAAALEAAAAEAAAASAAMPASAGGAPSEPAHPHAWKAGPVILLAGGVAAFVAVGVAAGVQNDSQQLNTGAVAAWSAIGAAAIAGGIAWWVVGDKRRNRKAESSGALAPAIALRPTGIDLWLRF